MAKPVVTASLSWPTQQAAEKECVNILRNSGYLPGDKITDLAHIAVLTELLNIHPRALAKIGVGLDHFQVKLMAKTPGQTVSDQALGIWISRVDGSGVDFSYQEAISPSDDKRKVTSALKAAVEDSRLAYRESRFLSGNAKSDVSGAPFGRRSDASVIYVSPTFAQLAFRFAESEGGWAAVKLQSGGSDAFIGEELSDPGQLARWRTFYETYARRSLVTRSEGARRPRSNEADWTP